MAFRVSDASMFSAAVRSTRLQRYELNQLQTQLSSGKRVNTAGDDPGSAAQIVGLRKGLSQLNQYQRNIESARSTIEPVETALGGLTSTLTRLRELAISADIETGEFDKIQPEVEQLFDQVLALSNTEVNGRYLFAGFNTDTVAFTKTGAFVDGTVNTTAPAGTYGGDNGAITVQIGATSTVQANVTGREVFLGSTDGDDTPDGSNVDIFAVIRDLRNRLLDPAGQGRPADVVGNIDAALDQVLATRGELGARLNRLSLAQGQLSSIDISLQTELSTIEDLDFIQAATDLANREQAFQASLAVTARVIQPSLINFLG